MRQEGAEFATWSAGSGHLSADVPDALIACRSDGHSGGRTTDEPESGRGSKWRNTMNQQAMSRFNSPDNEDLAAGGVEDVHAADAVGVGVQRDVQLAEHGEQLAATCAPPSTRLCPELLVAIDIT